VTGAAWLLSLSLAAVCGWPLLSHRSLRGLPLSSRLVLSGAAGAVLLSAAMTCAVVLGLRWSIAVLVPVAAAMAAALRPFARGEAPSPPPGRDAFGGGTWTAAAHALAALAVAVAFLATWSGAATSPDLIFFWGAKAQQFAAARTIDVPFLQNVFHRYMHLYYPPFVTNVYAFATMAAGRFPWTAATLTFPLLLGALAVGLPGILRTRVERRAAAALSALAIAAIACAGIEADVAGNAEMPLLLFETMAIALLVSPHARQPSIQLVAGILLAGVATAKVEGLPFVLATAALFLLLRPDARPIGAVSARLLLPAVACLGIWFLFGATRHLFTGYAGEGKFLDLYPGRLAAVVRSIGAALAATGYGLPWLVPLAVLVVSGRLRRASLIPLGTAAALTAFFLFTYLHRAENPALWISWSAARIFMPVAMLLVVATACGAPPSPLPEATVPPRGAPSPR